MCSIGLKFGVNILFAINIEGHAASSVFVVIVDVHDRYLIPSFLKEGNGQENEVLCSFRFDSS